jgi:hypothetical protein
MIRVGALAAMTLVAAAPAPRVLDPEGLGRVRIGMTVAAAERALGARLRLNDSESASEACVYAQRRDRRDKGVAYMVEGGRVSRIDISESGIRTARGIGIGSTIAQIRKAYGRAIMSHPNTYTDQPEFELSLPGHRFGLVFLTEHGSVTAMRGGSYPAVGYVEGCL